MWRRYLVVAALAATYSVTTAESGCMSTESTTAPPPLDCVRGTHEENGRCVANPPSVVITIDPTPHDSFHSPSKCPTFIPNPASVRTGDTFAFKNTTAQTITIQGNNGTPWTTVEPGKTSGNLSFSSAGRVLYTAQGCGAYQSVGDNYYGSINVTIT
jgi:hypothetical protein